MGFVYARQKARRRKTSNHFPGRLPRRPCPLEVVATEPTGDVNHFTDEKKPGNELRLHRAGRNTVSIDAPQGDFGSAIAFGAAGGDRPVMQLLPQATQLVLLPLAHRPIAQPEFAQSLRQALGPQVGHYVLQSGGGPLGTLRDQPVADILVWREIDTQIVARLPIRGNLQNRRPADTAMGKQHARAKATLADPRLYLRQGHAGQILVVLLVLAAKGQWHQASTRRQHCMAKLARQLVAKTGGAHARNRKAARGDHQRGGMHFATRGLYRETLLAATHPLDTATGFDTHAGGRAFVKQHPYDLL